MDTNLPTTSSSQPDPQIVSFDQKSQFFDELANNDYDALVKKYGKKTLFEKTYGQDEMFATAAQFTSFQRHFFILKFWPADLPVNLDDAKRKRIVDLIMSISPEHTDEQVLGWLKQIDTNLILPEKFDRTTLQPRAIQIARAYENIEQTLLDNMAPDYLLDTVNFYKFSDQQLSSFAQEIDLLSTKFVDEYTKLLKKNGPVDQAVIDEATKLLGKIGRSQFFIAEEKEKKDLGYLAELFIKLEVALKVAQELKKQPKPADLNQAALDEIKKTLKPGIQI